MGKRKFDLSERQVNELQRAYALCKEGAERTRYQAVRLYSQGYSAKEIQEIAGCSRTSLLEWCRAYAEQGTLGLVDRRLGGNNAKLRPAQMADLRERLEQYTPRDLFGSSAATLNGQYWTVVDLARALQQWYRVTYASSTSYYHLFAVCGFSYQRTERVFKSRRPLQVAEFEEKLEKNSQT
jgi:transposase